MNLSTRDVTCSSGSRDRSVNKMAAASRKRHVSSAAAEQDEKRVKIDLNDKVEKILQSKKHANAVFDIFEVLQVKKFEGFYCHWWQQRSGFSSSTLCVRSKSRQETATRCSSVNLPKLGLIWTFRVLQFILLKVFLLLSNLEVSLK